MTKLFRYFLAATLLIMSSPAFGQVYDSFFRGSTAASYKYFHNGNPYWNDRTFIENCTVFFDGKEYGDLVLNIDANYQQVLLKRLGDVVPMVVDRDKLSWFTMKDSLFVNLSYAGVKDAPVGYYKIISDNGDVLMTRTDKQLAIETGDANGNPIGYRDPNYNSKVSTYFQRVITFWLYKDNKLYKISSKGDILRLYPQYKKEMKKAMNPIVRGTGSKFKRLERQLIAAMRVVGGPKASASLIPSYPFHIARNAQNNLPEVYNPDRVVLQSSLISSLPSGWFNVEEEDDDPNGVVKYVNGTVTKAIHSNKTYELGDKTIKKTGKATISGHVYSLGEGTPIVEATVYDEVSGTYVTTDKDGFYSITLPLGENVIHFSEYAMEDFNAKVIVYDNAQMEVQMKERSEMLQSALIAANSRANHRTAKMGIERMTAASLNKMPSAFGEGDVLKAIQTFPGVKSVGEAAGGINVRGGSTDQNLIL
ncbi:MAG: carboxypeptidase-like regulatory domain-containing protein, partial [Bacteroidales bacterium]|nr:carboxypeptidase-like regulatory domain-containing protein [Bacteroidales bacterium]